MKKLILLFSIVLAFTACKDETKNAHLQITLVDAPADYQAVEVDVESVQISSTTDGNGYQDLDGSKKGVIDLLKLTGGLEAVLADAEIPAGKLSQIRLVLGSNNSVTVDGVKHDLDTPSAQQSGLKLNVHMDLVEGVTYKIQLDFDAAKSIIENGNGTYSLKPVIRTNVEALSGAITGTVVGLEGVLITAKNGTDEYTTYTNAEGKFLLGGLPAGTYTIQVTAASSLNLADQDFADVAVVIGQSTALAEIQLLPIE